MSESLPGTTPSTAPAAKGRKQVVKKLSSGQRITLSLQDERTLRTIYDYLAGYSTRRTIEAQIEEKKGEVNRLHNSLPPSARLLLQMQPKNGLLSSFPAAAGAGLGEGGEEAQAVPKSETDLILDQYFKAKESLQKLEDKLKAHASMDHKISFRDLDAILKTLGATFHRKQIDQLIWEVDENLDGMVDFDELQLTYYRNLTDSSGSEPCFFFKILEFLIFDASHKGYIIEDDCMEILYARYGGGNLEREMKLLFGSRLRAEGGDGTLNLPAYLEAVLGRIGRRALVF
eukprot:gene7670-8477_t